MEGSRGLILLETERTTFLQLASRDYDDICALYSDPSVREFLGGPVEPSAFADKFDDMFSAVHPEYYWIVREKQTNACIGLVSITLHHDDAHFEISYELNASFWGQGYGAEIVQQGIDYAFTTLGLSEIYAETQQKNVRSIKLLEKLGMELVDTVERFDEQQCIYVLKNSK